MPGNVVRRQAVQLGHSGLNGLGAFLDIAAELEREDGGLFVQGLQVVAGGLILVNAGQPVAKQRALEVVPCGRAGVGQIDGREGLVDRSIQAEGAAGHGYPLRLSLCLVAHGTGGGYGVQYASLCPGQVQLFDGQVIGTQGVLRCALAFDR